MNNNTATATCEIKFSVTKKGQKRAYRYSWMQFRWFPIPLAEAELLVATGQAEDYTGKFHL